MPTDTERREAARKLRFNAGTAPYMNTSDDFAREVFRATMNEAVGDYRAAIDRLADLIDPGELKTTCIAEVKIEGEKLDEAVNRAIAEYTGIDRDALLALADEMSMDGMDGLLIPMSEYARRIREALGVQDA